MCVGASILTVAYGQIYARNFARSGGEKFAIPSMGHSMQRVLLNPPVDGQIHARNLKGPAERDLLCQAHAEGSFCM